MALHEVQLKGYSVRPGNLSLGTFGSYGIEQLHVTLDDTWSGLAVTATFNPPKGEPLEIRLPENGLIDVPAEATANEGTGTIVYCGVANGVQRITKTQGYNVITRGPVGGTEPFKPSESLATQVLQAALNAEKNSAEAKTAAASSVIAAANSATAAKASENAAAASEDNARISAGAAAVSERNAAASADKAKASETAAAESASNASKDAAKAASAAKKAADESVAANIAAIENMQADVASKQTAAAASENAAAASAVAAAGSAAQAETQKTAAENAASDAHGYMQTASGAAIAANASAENAAGSKATAENSASAAAGSEQAAGTSELKAAKSEKAAKASEQAASESAQAAMESKTAAATSEVNAAASAKKAKDIADSLPEDYTTAVNEIAALKTNKADKTELETVNQQVANITPDDMAVDGKPWTSKKIVDSLCQPFEESGNPVQVYPVENYPLVVKVSWEPVQEGEGDPSPDNIRPITGRDAVSVTRCGKNLFNVNGELISSGGSFTVSNNAITFTDYAGINDYFPFAAWVNVTANTDYIVTFSATSIKDLYIYTDKLYGNLIKKLSDAASGYKFNSRNNTKLLIGFYSRKAFRIGDNETVTGVQVEKGSTPTTYIPYIGQTNTLTLPETVYGGEVDAVSGESSRTWRTITLTGEEDSYIYSQLFYIDFRQDSSFAPEAPVSLTTGKSSHYRYNTYAADCIGVAKHGGTVVYDSNGKYPVSAEGLQEWKAYLASQYAAGTPVQVCYKLAEPVPFTATGAQNIPALSGVNTLYTDADGVVVAGAEDPKHTITELKNAIISLGGNI